MTVDLDIHKHNIVVQTDYDKELYMDILKNRWNPWKEEPIADASGLSQALRRVVNSDESRIKETVKIINGAGRAIIFYNFDYELEMLRKMCEDNGFIFAEWNGHKHQIIPNTKTWVYLVHYAAGAEGWNCTLTDTIIFYSQNHSYKMMTQAAGRIERMNTPFKNLYYYHLMSNGYIDKAIKRCLENKKDFNEHRFIEEELDDEFSEKYSM
jgi:superfamily II DNA or RNA helicase